MATILSPSNLADGDIPTATLALPSSASRRLPPPCWTLEETVALIDAYKDKWYSLRRGNLRANHWQEVADDVASRCPANAPKTAVQCRHKMEKLRKRYRGEIQRSAAHGGARLFTSSWPHFQNMHSMEKGTDNPTPPSTDDEDEDENHKNSIKRINDLYKHHTNHNGVFVNQNGATPGFRIKIPGGIPMGPAKVQSRSKEMGGQNANPRSRYPESREGVLGKRMGAVGEVVAAIEALGEGFMRMEKAKMEMAREVEEMRMEMELKRTEMMVESQQRIFDAFANAINKKPKNNAAQ